MTTESAEKAWTGVELLGTRTRLREFREADGPAAYRIVGDDRVTHFLSFDSRDMEAAQAMVDGAVQRARSEPRNEYYLAMTRADDDGLIGFCRLALSGVQAAKLGYAVAAEHWGLGFASDAVSTMLGFGFTTLDLHRITAAIGPDNHASQTVVSRLGFKQEGILRDHVFTNGAWRDSVLYSILSHEWTEGR
ncbi:GNAT family N-acetyltransferase [Amycolatopsis roodepoortensis]|uniref:GNAT family N-acetyltransferase n=1 Tax=Amycolatopsis roodepoortensis TaxID=700274 RepID=UPI00214BD0AF|nr:GNAT family protein [Amycolatopsis roodepoortensis]UUV33569.1 GNAT family N-acetyltransferase [Amycolatopsis roodepoortensis]